MSILTIIPLLFLSSLPLQADPECAETEQRHEQMLIIYRSVPELQALHGKSSFDLVEFREVAPGYYLLCSEVGSGAFVYHFAIVKHNLSDDSWNLVDEEIISSETPQMYIYHAVKGSQYQVEILFQPNNWITVFTGTFPTSE